MDWSKLDTNNNDGVTKIAKINNNTDGVLGNLSTYSLLGYAVALNNTGDKLIGGAMNNNTISMFKIDWANADSAKRINSGYSINQYYNVEKILPNDNFGNSVAISSDWN